MRVDCIEMLQQAIRVVIVSSSPHTPTTRVRVVRYLTTPILIGRPYMLMKTRLYVFPAVTFQQAVVLATHGCLLKMNCSFILIHNKDFNANNFFKLLFGFVSGQCRVTWSTISVNGSPPVCKSCKSKSSSSWKLELDN